MIGWSPIKFLKDYVSQDGYSYRKDQKFLVPLILANSWALDGIVSHIEPNGEQIPKDPASLLAIKEFGGYRQKVEEGFASPKPNFSGIGDHITIAQDFINENPMFFDRNKIWWMWDKEKLRWWIIDDVDILNSLNDSLGLSGIVNSGTKNQYLTAMQMVARKREPEPISNRWIQFKNCVVDISSHKEHDVKFLQPSPEYFLSNPIPHDFLEDPKTECPIIDGLFEEWVGKENKQILYEICAYSMLPDYPIHVLFCLFGSGNNGKGRFQALLRRLIGSDNVTSSDLQRLNPATSRFESTKLYKKLIAQIGETDFTILKDTSLIKKLTGQDLISAEFKNKNPFDFENFAKIIINTNSLPMTLDKTEGFFRRWIIIDFPNRFPKTDDPLLKIPDDEYSRLATKCLYVLCDILNKREFHGQGDIEHQRKRFEEKSNPTQLFIRERCERDVDSHIWLWEFRDNLESFLKERGYRAMTEKEMVKIIDELGYERKRLYTVEDGKERQWIAVLGLKWKNKTNVEGNGKLSDFFGIHSSDSTYVPLYSPYKEMSRSIGTIDTVATGLSDLNQTKDTIPVTPKEENISYNSSASIRDIVYNLYPNQIDNAKTEYDIEQEATSLGISPAEFHRIHIKLRSEGFIFEARSGRWSRL